MSWHRRAHKIIDEATKDNEWTTKEELSKVIRDAYPWGPRTNHPYKMWLKARKEVLNYYFPKHLSMTNMDDLPLFTQEEDA